MSTQLEESISTGVMFEFRDEQGHTLGQSIHTDWRGRPLPAAGDTINCQVRLAGDSAKRRVRGRVAFRQFDIQSQSDGQPCVWVWIVVLVPTRANAKQAGRPGARFSVN